MSLVKARLTNASRPQADPVEVLFNPTEYSIDRGASYAEIQVPGLEVPIQQFVRGEAETLSLELFLDGTNQRRPVESELAKLRDFVLVDPELHAPPVCHFAWGRVPGGRSSDERREARFTGIVTSMKEKYSLFDEAGNVLRARVNLTMKSYRPVEVQQRETPPASPDRTRVRVLREGETLSQVAREVYGDPRRWRLVARTNDVDRPRFVRPGTTLRVPAATGRSGGERR